MTLPYIILVNLELTEMNPPEKEGYEYRYAMFEQLPYIYVDSSKHKPVLAINVSNIDATRDPVMKKKIMKT